MNNSIKSELEKYISELDREMKLMQNSDFPFSDYLLIYEEVCDHLKHIVGAE